MSTSKKIFLAESLLAAVSAYRAGKSSLGGMVNKIEILIAELDTPALTDGLFDARLGLEEVYAQQNAPSFDFERVGLPVVTRCLEQIEGRMQTYLASLTA